MSSVRSALNTVKLISWNTNHRTRQALDQAQAILRRAPDVVALQEIISSSVKVMTRALSSGGLPHVVTTVGEPSFDRRGPRAFGVLIASRYPLVEDATVRLPVPWGEKSVSAVITAPLAEFEVHTVHVPPGSSNGWVKIEVLEAVFVGLSRGADRPRLLCGDFNTPQHEFSSGEIVTWAQRIGTSGQVSLRTHFRGGSGLRWDAAERNILSGLQQFGMRDVYRGLHGYEIDASSWVLRRKGTSIGRRFDHIFASKELHAVRCTYLNEWREVGLSDHAGLEAEFTTAV